MQPLRQTETTPHPEQCGMRSARITKENHRMGCVHHDHPGGHPVASSAPLAAHSCGGSHEVGACWLHLTLFPCHPASPSGTIVGRDAMLRLRRAWHDLHATSVFTGAFESSAHRCLPMLCRAARLKTVRRVVSRLSIVGGVSRPTTAVLQMGQGDDLTIARRRPCTRMTKEGAGPSSCGSEERPGQFWHGTGRSLPDARRLARRARGHTARFMRHEPLGRSHNIPLCRRS